MSPEIMYLFILLPLICGLLCFFTPKFSKPLTLIVSLSICYGSLIFLLGEQESQSYTFSLSQVMGINFHVAINGLNAAFLFLSGVFLLLSNSFAYDSKSSGLLILMATFTNGAFLASDLLLFFIFFELMILPSFFLLGFFGQKEKFSAGIYFMVFSAIGSLMMLAAILYIGGKELSSASQHTFLLSNLITDTKFNKAEESLLFLAFIFSFAVKTPLFLFHSWQPLLYINLPRSALIYMAAVISKVGLYGVIRIVLQLFPNAFSLYGEYLAAVAVFGSLIASLIAWRKDDIISVLAYSSIAHLSLCFFGLSANTPTALQGVFITMVSHTLVTGGMFFLLFSLERANSKIPFGGVAATAKGFSSLFVILTLASVAVPLSGSFVGEFLIFAGAFKVYPVLTLYAVFVTVFSSLYMLKLLKGFLFGVSSETIQPISFREAVIGSILCASVLVIGVYPKILTDKSQEALSSIMTAGSIKMIGNKEEFYTPQEDFPPRIFQGVSLAQ